MPSPETTAAPPAGAVDLDRTNLAQALRDFELANRRVVDLTQRLLDATDEVRALRTELETLRIEHAQLLATHHETHTTLAGIQRSRAYAAVRAARSARRLLGR